MSGDMNISGSDTTEEVAQLISDRLEEPNRDLIHRVVSILGKEKSLEIYQDTLRTEEQGGLMTADGSRRRTAGGVFFHSVTHCPSIARSTVQEIFAETNSKQRKMRNKAIKERRAQKTIELKNRIIKEGLLTTIQPQQSGQASLK